MATTLAPPRTPSPKVRIRSQSFDSPSSHTSITPMEMSPFSRSTGAIATEVVPHYSNLKAPEQGGLKSTNVPLPLHTKMSDDSILSDASSTTSSSFTSSTNSEEDVGLKTDSPSPLTQRERQRPHPLAFCQSITYDATPIEEQPSSPFLYQDPSYPMYSPWLVQVVLSLHDVMGLDWMSIAEPVQRRWGVQTSSAEVLDILSDNGRVLGRKWWD
ncbi:hypothetical protein DE146DRAFT_404274 [Phaeosphaeria sp. MPI-PUGE-AT-0046c]|nr:hypothetical protein DE146DRAFT_404274 [Phaeosphaeria sp. MPI-PUGE-AT-0046c]